MKTALYIVSLLSLCQFANAKGECRVALPKGCQYMHSNYEVWNGKITVQVDCNYVGNGVVKHISTFDLRSIIGWTKITDEVQPDQISFIPGSQQQATIDCK